jgi:Fic family protein
MALLQAFEPLLPSRSAPQLDELAEEVCRHGFDLKQSLHPDSAARIAATRGLMNADYSFRIELGPDHPLLAEQALRRKLEEEPGRSVERLAVAHLDTRREMETWLAERPGLPVFGAAFLCRLHRSFYARLTREDRLTRDGEELRPGELRRCHATVGKHVTPDWRSIEAFLSHADNVYAAVRDPGPALIAIACAHHRLAWVHPFRDGNGRVLRLQSQAALIQHGVGSALWSIASALARDEAAYQTLLADADALRRDVSDGPGDLSEGGLLAFAWQFLYGCLGEITLIIEHLDLPALRHRLRTYVTLLSQMEAGFSIEAVPALHGLFLKGPMAREKFKQMTGLPRLAAEQTLEALVRHGLVESTELEGPVSLGLPLDAAKVLFPRLTSSSGALRSSNL